MKVLVYTFYNRWGKTSRLLYNLHNPDVEKFYINNGLRGVNQLISKIKTDEFDFIIGLGDYRKDAKRIRIESVFINRYGRKPIIDKVPSVLFSTASLVPCENSYIGDKPSNGPCNRSAFLLQNTINENNLKTKLAFVHVPRSFDSLTAEKILSNWIDEFQN